MSRPRFGNLFLNVALLGAGLAVLVLLYGLAARTFTPRTAPVREDNPAQLTGDVIQIEVRNGAGVAGVAGTVTSYLRRRGFDVVESGNYRSFDQEQTVVLDRVGNPEAAQRVANALGLGPDRIQDEPRADLYLDASVIVGQDFESLAPFRDGSSR
jgi:hypothetical protein